MVSRRATSAGVTARPAGEAADPAPPEAIYVHVPFCLSLCPYCDFVVYAGTAARGPRSRVGAFLAGLATELDLRADALDATFGPADPSGGRGRRPVLGSLYIGGGTPSLLAADAVEAIVQRVRDRFGLALDAEVTLEANPGADDRGDLPGFARAGVNRLSIGAQSLDPAELRALGRRHAPGDVVEAVAAAREAGIAAVNLDLLYDLPGQRLATFAQTVDAVLELRPEHVSLYALTLDDPDAEGLTGPAGDHLPTTPGARRWRERARQGQDEDTAAAAYAFADGRLAEAGLAWYELSNWAVPGAPSRHNLAYWRRRPYEAVGPGAHAFDGATRRWNAARLDGWLAALVPSGRAAPRLPPGGSEPIDASTAAAERLVLGLRLAEGVPRSAMATHPEAFAWAAEAGLVEDAPGGRVRLTLRGRLLSNEVLARLV